MTREEKLAANREWQKRYRLANPEVVKARKQAYSKTEAGKMHAAMAQKRHYASNPEALEKRREQGRERAKTRYLDPRVKAQSYLNRARANGGCTSTLDEAEAFMRNKPELCQCCFKAPAKHLDHKHNGPIRAWTCHPCNIHLGVIEKEGFLEIALAYLDRTKKKD